MPVRVSLPGASSSTTANSRARSWILRAIRYRYLPRSVPANPAQPGSATAALLAWMLGCAAVYAALFGTGMALYGRFGAAAILAVAALGRGARQPSPWVGGLAIDWSEVTPPAAVKAAGSMPQWVKQPVSKGS